MGSEPYQRLSSLLQYNFNHKIWQEENPEKTQKILQGFQLLYQHNENKNVDIENMYKIINEIIRIIIDDEKTKQMEPPKIPKSTAKDYHGFNQRELMKIIKCNNLNESALKLLKILSNLYNSENKELILHRTTKIFF